MSFQNTIKCMKKYNRYAVRDNVQANPNRNNFQEGLKTSREEEVVKQCFQLNEILNNMKNVNFENIESEENDLANNNINSPRIVNLKQKKEELELKIKQHKPKKPIKPPKIINSKIANINK